MTRSALQVLASGEHNLADAPTCKGLRLEPNLMSLADDEHDESLIEDIVDEVVVAFRLVDLSYSRR